MILEGLNKLSGFRIQPIYQSEQMIGGGALFFRVDAVEATAEVVHDHSQIIALIPSSIPSHVRASQVISLSKEQRFIGISRNYANPNFF